MTGRKRGKHALRGQLPCHQLSKVYIPKGILSPADKIVLVRGACLPPEALVSSPISSFQLFSMRGESL
ncbi:hypothetical protein B6U74_05225 [Candidatus Bathyarchaeota archaeon ex4484_205]|nr:MAG: hypothetical protein B6U74_05225 [Candidatus Bathyarchaeota archaeon ex4484_205]